MGARPSTSADTATAAVPGPGRHVHGTMATLIPVATLLRSQSLSAPPLGLTVPFSVAEVCVSADAAPVMALGAADAVVNVWSAPEPVPPALLATIRKW